MKPLTMLEFVQESNELESIKNYAKFLSQKPEKWMFVPCDEQGNVLEDPKVNDYHFDPISSQMYCDDKKKYKQALDRVIFEGFEKTNCSGFDVEKDYKLFKLKNYDTIEQLIYERGDFLTLKKTIK